MTRCVFRAALDGTPPPARSLWRRYDPTVYATIWGFDRSPEKIWQLLSEFIAETTPLPNKAHLALAELQALGVISFVVTQNVGATHACSQQHVNAAPARAMYRA